MNIDDIYMVPPLSSRDISQSQTYGDIICEIPRKTPKAFCQERHDKGIGTKYRVIGIGWGYCCRHYEGLGMVPTVRSGFILGQSL